MGKLSTKGKGKARLMSPAHKIRARSYFMSGNVSALVIGNGNGGKLNDFILMAHIEYENSIDMCFKPMHACIVCWGRAT